MAIENKTLQRPFSIESALHLFSSSPAVLMPADIYVLKESQNIKKVILDCNIYLMTSRRRMLIDHEGVSVKGDVLLGYFIVLRNMNMARIPFQYTITIEHIGKNVGIRGGSLTVWIVCRYDNNSRANAFNISCYFSFGCIVTDF